MKLHPKHKIAMNDKSILVECEEGFLMASKDAAILIDYEAMYFGVCEYTDENEFIFEPGGVNKMQERVSRSKAIRLKCLDCCCGQSAEVRRCPVTECALWRYRMGKEENDELRPVRKNPQKSDEISDEDPD